MSKIEKCTSCWENQTFKKKKLKMYTIRVSFSASRLIRTTFMGNSQVMNRVKAEGALGTVGGAEPDSLARRHLYMCVERRRHVS